ncbi:porimin [Chiroxiphia lanceolata]|uniref:porimin n=1 Tax=Chiroxiphia lanceolata TaxID=296741 RepID=UPI0013CECD7F|nr:porimin [Chiroxiphia lanceolata]
MRLFGGASCALLLLLLAPGSRNEDMNSTAPFTTISGQRLPDNSSSSNVTSVSSTQSAATSAGGVSTSTTHLTSTTQPTVTNMSVSLTTQPTKTSQTIRSTTASSVTSSQLYITVVTTSKISSTSVTATSKSEASSRFDVGSFVGGIVLTLGVLVILYIGCKTYHSRRGIQYRTIDEHDAII